MSETFYSTTVIAISKSVVTMLEDIKVYLMERWESNRKKFGRYEDDVLPNIKKKIVGESAYTDHWLVRYVFYCECYCKSVLFPMII